MKKIWAVFLAALLALSCAACSSRSSPTASASAASASSTAAAASTLSASDGGAGDAAAADTGDMFTARDAETTYADYVAVTLADGASRSDGSGVAIDGDTVTITAEGTYLLTGTLTDGQIVVNADDSAKVQLVLSGASVTCSGSAALYIAQADKVFLTTAEGTENTLASVGAFAQTDDNNVDGAVFSRCDLTLNGEGTLAVTCESGHGIVSKDDLAVTGGTYDITAAKHGLSGKDSVRISGGTVTIDAGTDGIHAENADDAAKGFFYLAGGTLDITADSDGIDASSTITVLGGSIRLSVGDDGMHADAELDVSGGSIDVAASYEGLESAVIAISGGAISVVSSDDGLNAAGGSDGSGWGAQDSFSAQSGVSLTISGGSLVVNAGGDGLDSNGSLAVSGGTVCVSGPTDSGNGALDYNGSGVVTGGVIVAAGSAGMAENFDSDSTQGSILVNLSSVQPAGTTVTLTDSSGNVLASYTPVKQFQSVVVSAPGVADGGTYTLTVGSSSQTITMSSVIYGSGSGMGGGMMGGSMGGGSPGGMNGGRGFGGGHG